MHSIDKAKIQSYLSQSGKSQLDGWQSFDSCVGEKCGEFWIITPVFLLQDFQPLFQVNRMKN